MTAIEMLNGGILYVAKVRNKGSGTAREPCIEVHMRSRTRAQPYLENNVVGWQDTKIETGNNHTKSRFSSVFSFHPGSSHDIFKYVTRLIDTGPIVFTFTIYSVDVESRQCEVRFEENELAMDARPKIAVEI